MDPPIKIALYNANREKTALFQRIREKLKAKSNVRSQMRNQRVEFQQHGVKIDFPNV